MKKFIVSFSQEVQQRVEVIVEAKSEAEALQKFKNFDYDSEERVVNEDIIGTERSAIRVVRVVE